MNVRCVAPHAIALLGLACGARTELGAFENQAPSGSVTHSDAGPAGAPDETTKACGESVSRPVGSVVHPVSFAVSSNRLVAVGSEQSATETWCPVILSSADGNAWTRTPVACRGERHQLQRVRRLSTGFVAVGGPLPTTLLQSEDGLSWTPRAVPLPTISDIAENDGIVVVAVGHAVYRSTDGMSSWSKEPLARDADGDLGAYRVMFAKGRFLASSTRVLESIDGTQWALSALHEPGTMLTSFSFANEILFATFERFSGSPSPRPAFLARSFDGRNMFVTETPSWIRPGRIAFGRGVYVGLAVEDCPNAQFFLSHDGIHWSPKPYARRLHDVVFTRGSFFVSGENVILRSEDGVEWTPVYVP